MYFNNAKCDIYIGKGAGKKLMKEIHEAQQEIQIVSPYLSAYLVKELIMLHEKGIRVKLITTDDIEDFGYSNERNLYKLIQQSRSIDDEALQLRIKWIGIRKKILYTTIACLLLSIILPLFLDPVFGLSALGLALVLSFVYRRFVVKIKNKRVFIYHYYSLFPFRVYYSPRSSQSRNTFIHSKIYLIDRKIAYLGSLNFTKSGTKHNHETRIRTTDPEVVSEIIKEVDELFDHPRLPVRDIQKWGKQLYRESIN